MKGQIMATKAESNENAAKDAAKAKRHEVRAQKREARDQKNAESGKPERGTRVCVFSTVEVRKNDAGFEVRIKGAERRHKILLSPDEVSPILKDLESAIQVIRGQL
jgi:hypothetical protein